METAFLDSGDDISPPRMPLPPDATLPAPRLIENDLHYPAEKVSEEIPAPDTNSRANSTDHPHVEYSYEKRGIWRLPLPGIDRLHLRWITVTKPRLQATHWGYPEYFEERPFGSYVVQAEQMQMVNGLQDQQVLYHYDFGGNGSATLTPRGEYQLRKIIQRMEIAPCPIIIQTSIVNAELDEARRQHVLATLQAAGVAVEPETVVIEHPPLPGLQGVEAGFIYANLLGQTQDRGGGQTDGGTPSAVVIPVIGGSGQ